MGLRVSAAHELAGLDVAEMGMDAYPEGDPLGDGRAESDAPPNVRLVDPTT